MTVKSPQHFFDELDNIYEIKRFLKRGKNLKTFKCLFNHFFEENNKWVSSVMLQKKLCIAYHSVAYNILCSFSILNLLTKQQNSNKKVIFIIFNQSYWEVIKKDLERKEANNGGNGQNIHV